MTFPPDPLEANRVPRARVTGLRANHSVECDYLTTRNLEALDRSRKRDASGDSHCGPRAADTIAGDRGESGDSNRGDRNEWASGQRGRGHELEARIAHGVFNGVIGFYAHMSQILRI